MKNPIIIVTLVAATFMIGCNSEQGSQNADERIEEASQNLDQAKQDYNEEYNKFKRHAEEQIAANEKCVADLKDNAKDLKKEQKAAYEATIKDLEAKNDMMKQKLKDRQEEDQTKWESFKSEFSHDMEELGNAFNDIGKNNVK
jgi:hypothetical protein